ncbi:MAG: metallophosphoesterase, partial [Candidatus Riesia sp.]|nr:metallophosphoesterase [Candidatus Riesia sp.]
MSQTFTIVGLPDTQKYTKEENGGTKEMFYSQTQWISNNTNTENIVFVSHFGDITDDGDLAAESQWIYADNAMSTLDNVVPYAVLPGNHDKFGGTTKYNQYFGVDRFSGYVYYGGNYQGNENNYCLFSAGGMEFILISLEYWPLSDTRDWASSVLNTYSNRRAIITTHSLLNTDGTWTDNQHGGGENVYNMAKTHSNVFLMLCGHNHGEYVRSDTYDGNTIYTVLADYQDYTNGGNGYLRIMEFDPINDQINFKTYSPYINQWMTGNSSQFSIPYDMDYTSP